MNEQLVLVELDNTEPYLMEVKSKKKITVEMVKEYLEEDVNGLDWDEDSFTFINKNEIEEVTL